MIPKSGKNEEWDGIMNQIDAVQNQFHSHLNSLKKQLK